MKQYRDRVREYLAAHKLETYEKVFLNQFRAELSLSIEEADQILEEEWQPIEAAQQAYRALLIDLIDSDCDLADLSVQAGLNRFQTERKLTDAEVKTLLREVAEEYQDRLRRPKGQLAGDSVTDVTDEQQINRIVSLSDKYSALQMLRNATPFMPLRTSLQLLWMVLRS